MKLSLRHGWKALVAVLLAAAMTTSILTGCTDAEINAASQIIDKILEYDPDTSSSSSSSTKTDDTTVPTRNITVSTTYGAADLWQVVSYKPSSDFDSSIWHASYTKGGCAVAAHATALSALLDREVTPKEFYEKNGNSISMPGDYDTLAAKFDLKHKGGSSQSDLDVMLDNYLNNPNQYSAPIVKFTKGYYSKDTSKKGVSLSDGAKETMHYIVIYGRNSDGSYRCVDNGGRKSNGSYISGYRIVDGINTPYGEINGIFEADLKAIHQYYK